MGESNDKGWLGGFRALGELVARSQLASAAGRTFGGLRDLYTALGYKRSLTNADYLERYERNEVAGRVVDAYPDATWRGAGGELVENEDPNTVTAFETAWFELSEKLKVWPIFKRADKLAGLSEYSVILIGAPGKLEEPLPNPLPLDQIFFLTPFGQDSAKIATFELEPTNPRFGHPTSYDITGLDPTLNPQGNVKTGGTKRVHWTRVVHLSDGLLEDNLRGQPRLKRIWNRLDDLEKVVGGGSEAFWNRAHQGYVFNIDKDLKPDPKQKEEMSVQVDQFMHGMRRAIRSRGMNVDTLGSDTADFAPSVASIMGLISTGTGIPQRLLMGSERGELASTQDRENWTERVQDRRDEYAGPLVVRQLIDRLIEYRTLPVPAQYEVRWPEVNDMTDEMRVKMAVSYAEINQKAGEIVVLPNEIRDRVLDLEPLDPEEITDHIESTTVEEEPEIVEVPRAAKVKGLRKHVVRKRIALMFLIKNNAHRRMRMLKAAS